MAYHFREFSIPDEMLAAINRYVNDRLEPGSFLTAVICNDLKSAVMSADSHNIGNIPAYVEYFYNNTPFNCWGSPERMQAWLEA